MKMTFDQYINNPMGIKNAVFSAREMYKELYTKKLNVILVREVGKVLYKLFKKDNKYYVYMKIPSEVIEKFYYDVVIEFYTDNNTVKASKSLKDYYVKFYSNDPSFVFTFAHAMLKNDLFIRELTPKMSREAILKVAKEKNPNKEIGYVKSIYFTYLLMRNYGLFNKIIFDNEASNFNLKELFKEITHADEKIENRQEAQKELNKKNKKEKTNNIIPDSRQKNMISSSQPIKLSKNIGKVKNTNGINNIKRSKRI